MIIFVYFCNFGSIIAIADAILRVIEKVNIKILKIIFLNSEIEMV